MMMVLTIYRMTSDFNEISSVVSKLTDVCQVGEPCALLVSLFGRLPSLRIFEESRPTTRTRIRKPIVVQYTSFYQCQMVEKIQVSGFAAFRRVYVE